MSVHCRYLSRMQTDEPPPHPQLHFTAALVWLAIEEHHWSLGKLRPLCRFCFFFFFPLLLSSRGVFFFFKLFSLILQPLFVAVVGGGGKQDEANAVLICSSVVYFVSSCLCSTDRQSWSCERRGGVGSIKACGCRGHVRGRGAKETEKTAADHNASMSTEIKLVYYFQRGKKKQSYFTLVIIIKFLQLFSLHNIKK